MSIVAVPVTTTGQIHAGFGRAPLVATCRVENGECLDWTVHETRWDVLHDEGTEGSHHARIVRFMRDNHVTHVVGGHMGEPMQNTLAKLDIAVHLGFTGDAQAAACNAIG